MEIIINEDNLTLEEIQEFSTKVRAILVDENNRILIAKYGDILLLPGGKVDEDETFNTALIRELKEETGTEYHQEELSFLMTLNYYQKNYPKRDGQFMNRLIQTHSFLGEYKDVQQEKLKLTEKEKAGHFELKLIPLDELEYIILNNQNQNPRNIYFQKELLTIISKYKKHIKTKRK